MKYTFTGAFAPFICGLIEKKQAMTTTEVHAFFELLINSAVSNFRTRPAWLRS